MRFWQGLLHEDLHSRLHEWAYSVWELIHVWDI